MNAINFIKEHLEPFTGEINFFFVDEDGKSYLDYYVENSNKFKDYYFCDNCLKLVETKYKSYISFISNYPCSICHNFYKYTHCFNYLLLDLIKYCRDKNEIKVFETIDKIILNKMSDNKNSFVFHFDIEYQLLNKYPEMRDKVIDEMLNIDGFFNKFPIYRYGCFLQYFLNNKYDDNFQMKLFYCLNIDINDFTNNITKQKILDTINNNIKFLINNKYYKYLDIKDIDKQCYRVDECKNEIGYVIRYNYSIISKCISSKLFVKNVFDIMTVFMIKYYCPHIFSSLVEMSSQSSIEWLYHIQTCDNTFNKYKSIFKSHCKQKYRNKIETFDYLKELYQVFYNNSIDVNKIKEFVNKSNNQEELLINLQKIIKEYNIFKEPLIKNPIDYP